MTKTVSALFDNVSDAQYAVQDLIDNGFLQRDISLIASDAAGEFVAYHGKDLPADDTLAGMGTGAVLGGLTGLLVGLAALAIPGVGPVIAAGPIAAAITGAGVGAVTGGIVGALVDLGIDEDEAGYYAEGVRRGGTLLTVQTTDAMAHRAADILERHDPVNVEERVTYWRERGWTGYEPTAEPYTVDQIERERDMY